MPDGAIAEDLENISVFRKYVAANVDKWYRYVNGPRGREVKNGDIRLVVGCDKTTSWGMATVSNMSKPSQLKFKPLDGQASGSPSCGYAWEYSGTAEVRVGPDQKAIDELKRGDTEDSRTGNRYLNQCLFVRTLNATLSDDKWEGLNREIGVDCNLDSTTTHACGTHSHSPSNGDTPSDTTQSTSSTNYNFENQQVASDTSDMEFTSIEASAKHLIVSVPPTATVSRVCERGKICLDSIPFQASHPSRILNETLLKMVRCILI